MPHILNQFFEKIYCITRPEFTDRHDLMEKQLSGIEHEIIYTPDPNEIQCLGSRTPTETSGIYGHLLSIAAAKKHGYQRIAIWEDDNVIISTEDEMKAFFDELPEDWGFLYLANGWWNTGMWDDWGNWSKPVSEHVKQIFWGTCGSLTGIKQPMFDSVVAELQTGKDPCDFSYYHLFRHHKNAYCPAKKFFSDPISSPHESVRNRFDQSRFLPSRILHSF